MRRRLAFLSLAVATLVVVAFLVPVGILIRNQAQTRALSDAERDAQSVAAALAVAGVTSPEGITPEFAEAVVVAFGRPEGLSVVFLDGTVVGDEIVGETNVEQATRGAAFSAKVDGGAEVLVPVLGPDAVTTGRSVVVRTFVPDEELTRGVPLAWAMLVFLAFAIIAIAVFAADRLGRSVVKPVTDLSDAAHRWGQGELDTRVIPAGPEEIAEVGEAFNELAGRLDALLAAERESVADLSHRLRTPLTALRLQADALSDSAEAEALKADIDDLERAVDSMIQQARSHSATATTEERVDLGDVLRHRAEFWQVLADEQGRATSVTIEPGRHPVALPRSDLGALIDVLIENVFAHTPAGAGYRLAVRRRGDGRSAFMISDEGPGFGDLGVLRRGRSGGGGTGLGLDIVVRTVERTGGGVRVGTAPEGGAEISVVFGASDRNGRGV